MNHTEQAIEERLRNKLGQYIQTIKGGWKTKQNIYQEKYLKSHPWARNFSFSKTRAKRKNWEHNLTIKDFEELWFRDKAFNLKCPSIDRIDSNQGYIKENCRFIENSLNISLGNLGKVVTEKQRKAGAENLRKYRRLNPVPWNKKI